MMLLARAITQHYSTPTNNRFRTSSNIRNQAVIHDGRVDIQSKNVGYAGNIIRNEGRHNKNPVNTLGNGMVQQREENEQTIQRNPRTESNPRKPNVQCYNYNARGHYACDCPQPKVRDSKFFKEHMLLALKDEAGGNLTEEENDFMLDIYHVDDSLEELNSTVIMMARIQPTDNTGAISSRSDAVILSENAKESRLKMKDKMIQLVYGKLNAHHETFFPQMEFPVEQTYLSTAPTSNVSSESSEKMLDLLVKKMPNESKLLNLFVKLEKTIGQLQTGIDETLLKDRSRALIFDDQDELRQLQNMGVASSSISSSVSISEFKDTNLKKKVLLNTNSKSTSKDWGLRRSTLNHLMCMSYTDVAHVFANAARNYEILHERDDEDNERPDKR
nr:hypothetical protein [Tanacetum cinerariifolium]